MKISTIEVNYNNYISPSAEVEMNCYASSKEVDLLRRITTDCRGDFHILPGPVNKSDFMLYRTLDIKKVIFNDPATIVFWTDGTKTVVKRQEGDEFDPEKGLALAMSKKLLGNKSNFNNVFKKWLPKDEETNEVPGYISDTADFLNGLALARALRANVEGPLEEDAKQASIPDTMEEDND